MAKSKESVTGVNTHVATQRGQADGRIIEPGEYVPAGIPIAHHKGEETVTYKDGSSETVPISGGWMVEADEAPAPKGEEAPAA